MDDDRVPLVVLDASVAVKWFIADGEDGVSEARTLLAAHANSEIRLVAPALIAHELLGVIARGRSDAPAMGDAMEAFFDADIALVAPDLAMMLMAAKLVQERGVQAFDSAYAALASTLGCELATADRKLAHALEGVVRVRAV